MILFSFTVFLFFIGDVRCFYGIPTEYFLVCRTHEDDRTQEREKTNKKKQKQFLLSKTVRIGRRMKRLKRKTARTKQRQFTFLLERKAKCDARSAKSKHELFQ